MRTHKETFSGKNSFGTPEGRSSGLEKIVRKEIADQVESILRNM